jgi:lysocardiolipin and lysophospholipid acyltransferase
MAGLYDFSFMWLMRRVDHVSRRYKVPSGHTSECNANVSPPVLIIQSHRYAKKMDLPLFNNVLLPRTKGFVACINEFRDSHIKFVYGIPI